jgi:glycosyltransferase involved in cell wall biosynthesis
MKKILMYRSDWTANMDRQTKDAYGGVGYYRIVKVAEQVKKAGYDVDVVGAKFTRKGETLEERYTRIFNEYDVLWTCYTSHGDDASAMYYFRDKLNKKVVLDVDDNYLDILESHPLYDKLKEGKKDRAFIGTILSFADALTVSTEPLKQRLEEHFKGVYGMEKKIFVLPNFNDLKDWDFETKEKSKDKIVIGYAGSNSHQEDLKMFLPALGRVMARHKNVHFETCGAIELKEINMFDSFTKDALDRCDLIPSTTTFLDYPKMLANQPWDIAVAPLDDNKFTRCKSHIKWLEMSALKYPVIASKVYPYYVDLWNRPTIEHEKTGLLVKPHEWEQALELLIIDKNKRLELAENAYNAIKDNWQYENSGMYLVIGKMLEEI